MENTTMNGRIAWKCDECDQAAIVNVVEGPGDRDTLHDAARASHAQISPDCHVARLTVKYLDQSLN